MKAIANQFRIVLQALGILFWLILKELSVGLYHLGQWVYIHRRQIATHKATPWVLAAVATGWAVWQMYGHMHPAPDQTEAMETNRIVPLQPSLKDHSIKEYFLLTGQAQVPRTNRRLLSHIHSWIDVPHQDGGKSRKGTDCSGFVQNVYKETYGILLSRSSTQMYEQDVKVIDKEELTEGDLVFFDTFGGNTISHVGIYLDNQRFAHASTSRGVTIDSLTNPYYLEHYYASGRIKALEDKNQEDE